MATHATHPGGAHTQATHAAPARRSGSRPFVMGWTMFAGVLMIFGGLLGAAEGVAALNNGNVFTSTRDYLFHYDLTGWGWIHLVLGAVIALAGFAVMTRAVWARIVGVALASLGAMANFLWLPHYPLWGLALLAIDVFIVWALCADTTSEKRGS